MSEHAIKDFWTRLEADAALRDAFDTLLTSADKIPAEAIVRFGERHGFEFTKDELPASMRGIADGELTDAELEQVSGGWYVPELAADQSGMIKLGGKGVTGTVTF